MKEIFNKAVDILGDFQLPNLSNAEGNIVTITQADVVSFRTANEILSDVSPLTTKGDLHTFDTADTRLPVGTDGQILSADSAEGTGLKWIPNTGGGGPVDLGDLADVVFSGLTDGELLVYDNVSGDWINQTLDEAGVPQDTDDLTEGTNLFYTDERVDDRVSALLQEGTNITLTYDDVLNTLTIDSSGAGFTQEEIEDFAGAMFSGNTETLISATYDDVNGKIDLVVDNDLANYSNLTSAFITASSTDTLTNKSGSNNQWTNDAGYITATLTNEEVQDIVGAMLSGNTETLISVTYEDSDGTIDFVVDSDLSNYNNTTSGFQNTTGVNSLIDTRVDKAFVEGLGIDITESQITDLQSYLLDVGITDIQASSILTSAEAFVDTDLQIMTAAAIDDLITSKGYLTSFTETNDLTAAVTWANIPDANVPASAVTQHQAALTITESQISDLTHYTDENARDAIGSALVEGANITITVNDVADTITIASSFTDTQLTNEQVQDIVGAMVTGNTETLISVTYQDGDGTIDFVVDNDLANYSNVTSGFQNATQVNSLIDTRVDKAFVEGLTIDINEAQITDLQTYATASNVMTFTNKSGNISQWTNDSGYITSTLSNEQVQDIVGGMVTGNTETLISVTYQDSDGTLDFVVDEAGLSITESQISDLQSYLPTSGGTVSGNLIVSGNFTVNGTTTTVNTETVQVEDNLIVVNFGEVGAGVTAGTGGIEVERGTLTNYQFLFEESTDLFKIGEIGSLQAVATRADTPTANGIFYWSSGTFRLANTGNATLDGAGDATFNSVSGNGSGLTSLNATQLTSGTVVTS